jgi:hypothetical protein
MAELEEMRQWKQQSSCEHSHVSFSSWSEVGGDGLNVGKSFFKGG